ncbi:MAG: hypothetical protein R2909_20005 [Gemmatimonadales bacterium]
MKLWLKVSVSAGLLVALFVLVTWHQVREALSHSRPALARRADGFAAGHVVGVIKWRSFVNACRGRLRLDAALSAVIPPGSSPISACPASSAATCCDSASPDGPPCRPEAALWGG